MREALILQPERTPAALRIALAQLAPYRLAEMERQKDEVLTLAARMDSPGPLLQFLESWAVVIEIARFPAVAGRLHSAEYTAQILDKDDPAWRSAMAEIRTIHTSAHKSLARE
ncbi:hypothetical protein OG369_20880 [Streptomyces sp. NBC_01221]|nr:hypothetical protein [Streptomyces sp. NBC_01221]MCX4795705.1 hypothetical protein [Streptomyces sp. NBC_01242]WSJ36997.1 hypothetical protein OG772_13745 [Streptomyces sp. NBC_01321]WSP56776.1 hypothetical protein OG306_22185 [Streptomyces sp. NBC_01241]WSP63396.1 hypothetical protein OG466_16970 [Streptomyces sp. NBC_01240]